MRRVQTFSIFCGLAALSACKSTSNQSEYIRHYLPDAELSTDRLDFGGLNWGYELTRKVTLTNRGELPMGIDKIELNDDGMMENFTLTWSPDEITCPDSGSTTAAKADLDSGATTGGGGDDTGSSDGGGDGGGIVEGQVVLLEAGCKLPIWVSFSPTTVGSIYGSFRVDTVTEPTADDKTDPTYYRDPDNFHKVVLMEGSAERGFGNVLVTPHTVDMGHLWTGESATRYVSIYNVGDGDLTVGEPTLASDCDPGFAVDLSEYDSDRIIPPDTHTLFAVSFTAPDTDTAYCDVTITTDDEDDKEIEIKLQGNSGDDPEEVPPTVKIREPAVGYVHTSGDPVVVKLNVFDQNQPATSLICKIKSAVLQEASLEKCTPTDESGYVVVEIPVDLLDAGVDTLLVTVTDQAEKQAQASTTLLWKVGYPTSDDDGDGYGDDDPTSATWDCDDTNPNTYPKAAEIYDHQDNDCDGGIDEGTEGFDDDGDSVSEEDGDCDDDDPCTYPLAPEDADQKDNDCDGIVDEGTTFYDDDGDGFAEVDYDCDDNNAAINPAAVELCDGIDNNCNGLKDAQEGCISDSSTPMLIGFIRMSANAIGVGESSTMAVLPIDLDGQEVICTWAEDSDLTAVGHQAIDYPTSKTITWTAPNELPVQSNGADSTGEVYSVYVICTDEDDNQAWAFDQIEVYPEPVATYVEEIVNTGGEGACGGSGYGGGHKKSAGKASTSSESSSSNGPLDTGAALLLPLFGLLGLARRRRDGDEA